MSQNSGIHAMNADGPLTLEAFRLLYKMSWVEARRVVDTMLTSKDPEARRLGREFLSDSADHLMKITACQDRKTAKDLDLSEFDWELAKNFRRSEASFTKDGIVVPGYLNLRDLKGPMKVPIVSVERLNLAYTSDLVFPYLTSVTDGFLNLVGATNLSFPVLKDIEGELAADGAADIAFPCLTDISADVIIRSSRNLGLDKLTWIGGEIKTTEATGLRLGSLTNVGGHLDASETRGLEFPKLERIGGKLIAENSRSLSLPALKEVGTTLNLRGSRKFSAPLLRKIRMLLCGGHVRPNLPSLQWVGRQPFDPTILSQPVESGTP